MTSDNRLTYLEVGATAVQPLPAGYHHQRRRTVVGRGPAAFERVAAALMRWEIQQGAGLRPTDGRGGVAVPVSEGVEVHLVLVPLRILPVLRFVIPCRVIYVVQEPNRRGFAYGTLPGHPESGEELFFVELTDSGDVEFGVRAFSRGGRWFTRVAGPIGWAAQWLAVRRYVRAAECAAESVPPVSRESRPPFGRRKFRRGRPGSDDLGQVQPRTVRLRRARRTWAALSPWRTAGSGR